MRTVDIAVLTKLRTVLANVHDGQVPVDESDSNVVTSAMPYVVYYSDVGLDDTRRLSGHATKRETSFQVTYVGETRDQAKWAGEQARAQLADSSLGLPGGGRMRVADSQRVVRDNDARLPGGGRLFYGVDVYSVRTPIGT